MAKAEKVTAVAEIAEQFKGSTAAVVTEYRGLSVGKITVDGDTASAEVRTSAEGQAPSTDTVQLRRVDGSWRISSLAGTDEPGPAP